MKPFATIVGLLAIPSLTAQEVDVKPGQDQPPQVWFADFDKAVEAAKQQKKDLFVDFTGSDWCGWCIRLHKEVFEHESFLTGAQKQFVLVALDFPQGEDVKAKVPNPERNEQVRAKYGVEGFPTILLMDTEGEVFGKTGYQPGGPDKYLAMVTEKASNGKARVGQIKELEKRFSGAGEDEKGRAAIVAEATALLAGMTDEDVGVDKVATIVKTGLGSADAAVVEQSVSALMKSGQGDAAVAAKAAELDPKNEKGLLELSVWSKMTSVRDDETAKAFLAELDKLLELPTKDADRVERMLAQATQWSAGPLQDKELAKKYGELLKKRIEGTDRAERYKGLLEMVLGG